MDEKEFQNGMERLVAESKPCKLCGEPDKFAQAYGCPAGFKDCPYREENLK